MAVVASALVAVVAVVEKIEMAIVVVAVVVVFVAAVALVVAVCSPAASHVLRSRQAITRQESTVVVLNRGVTTKQKRNKQNVLE